MIVKVKLHTGYFQISGFMSFIIRRISQCFTFVWLISVDGGLSAWSLWSTCSQSCGDTAVKSRERTCTRPTPSGGGKNCSGETFEIKFCEKKSCHIDDQGKTVFALDYFDVHRLFQKADALKSQSATINVSLG